MAKSEVIVDGGADSTVCNVALYQLYLQTKMHDKTNHAGDTYQQVTIDKTTFDPRWYDIIVPMAKDESNWKHWAGPGRFIGRIASAAMGLCNSLGSHCFSNIGCIWCNLQDNWCTTDGLCSNILTVCS